MRQLGCFTWPGMEGAVAKEVELCIVCAAAKPGRPWRVLGQVVEATAPFQELHMDTIEMPKAPEGNHIIVGTDPFSGYVQAEVTSSTAQVGGIAFYDRWRATTGTTPARVHSDNGPTFQTAFTAHVEKFGSKHDTSLPDNSQGNGAAERANRSVLGGLRKALAEAQLPAEAWPSLVQPVVVALNTLPSAARGGYAPVTLAFGMETPTLSRRLLAGLSSTGDAVVTEAAVEALVAELRLRRSDAVEAARKERERRRERQVARDARDPRIEKFDVQVGDYVLCKRDDPIKTQTPFSGPYQVTRIGEEMGPLVIEVRRLGTDETRQAHARDVRFFVGKAHALEGSPQMQRFADYTAPHRYTIERLLGVRREGRTYKFEVAWRGYQGKNTWEPAKRVFQDAPGTVRVFLEREDLTEDQSRLVPGLTRYLGL